MNLFRFPTTLSVVLVVVGIVTALAGAVYALKIFIEPGGGWLRIGGALAVAVGGLLVIACGEIIGVLFAMETRVQSIEDSTQRTHALLERHLAVEENTPDTMMRQRVPHVR